MRTIRQHVTPALLLVLTALGTAAASAQAPQRPAPEIQRLVALAGRFEGEATYTVAGKVVRFTLRHENRVIASGFGLATHEAADVPGMGHYDADDLFGWDAGKRQLHLYSVTSDPYAHDHAGAWTDATHATLHYEGVRDGRRMTEVIVMEVTGADRYRFHSTIKVPGAPTEVFVAAMTRASATSAR